MTIYAPSSDSVTRVGQPNQSAVSEAPPLLSVSFGFEPWKYCKVRGTSLQS